MKAANHLRPDGLALLSAAAYMKAANHLRPGGLDSWAFIVKRRKRQEYTAPEGTIQHVHELLQLMSVMTGDKRFEESYSQDMKGGVTMMTDILDKVEEKGMEKGMEKGKLELLAGLVKKGILTLQQAADERSLTVDDFKKQCVKYNLSL